MTTTTNDPSDSDHKSSDDHDEPTTAAIADNIEPLNAIPEEENEVSLDGFGSESITSTSIDEEEDEDPNAYYRNEIIERENKKYTPRRSDQQELELELTPELKQAGIVNRFAYYRKTNAIQLLLNHHYDSKSIVFSVDKKDWNKTHSIFEKQLKQKGISKEHILQLSDVLDNNYQVILGLDLESESDLDSGSEMQPRSSLPPPPSSSYQDQSGGGDDSGDDRTTAQKTLALAEDQCDELFHDQFNAPYAAIQVGNHIEILPLKSSRFRNWLCRLYYEFEQDVLSSETASNVINVLKAKAEFEGITRNLSLRVANIMEEPFTIYYDLTDKDWFVIKITEDGWDTQDASVIFRRYSNQQPQVYPCKSKEYPSDIFDRFMNLINVKGEDNKLLLKCYIISLFYPEIPKPILMLPGEQGSGKSTLQELIRMLVDPSSIRTLTFPRDINELVQNLSHNYIAYFDNVSLIPDWISDQLCRAVTGGGFSKRELYTNDDDIIYNFKRCIGFNGINLGATKADLLDRGIIIELERIARENQREIEEIWAEFDTMKPHLLSYIFDILVKVLQVKKNGGIKLKRLSRMADFAKHTEIISRCIGYDDNKFIDAFDKNIELQVQEAIAANPVGSAIIRFIEELEVRARNGVIIKEDCNSIWCSLLWTGTATELLVSLEEIAVSKLKINTHAKLWPKAANTLSRRINEIKTNLREVGITIDRCFIDEKKKSKGIKICKVSSEPSEPSETESHAQVISDISDDTYDDPTIVSTEDKVSSEEIPKNHAQIRPSDDTDDTDDILHTLQGAYSDYPPICYYCDYKPDSKYDYEAHVIMRHGHSSAYPNKAEIEKLRLKPQGKSWET